MENHASSICFHRFLELRIASLRMKEKISDELDKRVKKFLRGAEANLEGLKDKKLKGQLAVREELYGKSAQAAAKAEKWLLPSEGGYLEIEGIENTWRIKQESIALHLSTPPNGCVCAGTTFSTTYLHWDDCVLKLLRSPVELNSFEATSALRLAAQTIKFSSVWIARRPPGYAFVALMTVEIQRMQSVN